MHPVPTFIATAGLSFLTIASAAAQEDCRVQITALNVALAEHYPNLFGIAAGDVEPGDDAPEPLSGEPPETLATPTSEDVPTSVMPGAGPEIQLSEEEEAAEPGDLGRPGAAEENVAPAAGDSASGDPLPQEAEERAESVTEQPAAGRETGEEADSQGADATAESDERAAAGGGSLQERVDRIQTLRTLAEERLSTGHVDLCQQYAEQAMALVQEGIE